MSDVQEWECGACGATFRRTTPPPRCPRCGAPKSSFEAVGDDLDEEEEEYGVECPECGDWIPLPPRITLGKRVRCRDCGGAFRVTELDPPVLEDALSEDDEE